MNVVVLIAVPICCTVCKLISCKVLFNFMTSRKIKINFRKSQIPIVESSYNEGIISIRGKSFETAFQLFVLKTLQQIHPATSNEPTSTSFQANSGCSPWTHAMRRGKYSMPISNSQGNVRILPIS